MYINIDFIISHSLNFSIFFLQYNHEICFKKSVLVMFVSDTNRNDNINLRNPIFLCKLKYSSLSAEKSVEDIFSKAGGGGSWYFNSISFLAARLDHSLKCLFFELPGHLTQTFSEHVNLLFY